MKKIQNNKKVCTGYFAYPPSLLYLTVPVSKLEETLVQGILGSDEKKIQLFSDVDKALRSSYPRKERPIVLGVLAQEMYNNEKRVYKHNQNVWLIKEIETKYLKRLPFADTCFEEYRKLYGEMYLEYPKEKVMFRLIPYNLKFMRKYYGEKKETEVDRDNKLFLYAVTYGYEITQKEYKAGKRFSLQHMIHKMFLSSQ